MLMKKIIMLCCLIATAAIIHADEPKTLSIGEKAPDFELQGVDGKSYSLESFSKAEVLTIIFTANHCPTAQAYEERIGKLSTDYQPSEMQLVAISSNHPGAVCLEEMGYSDLGDSFEEMKIRAADKSFSYPYLYDGDTQEVAMAYGAKATPHVFIFDRERVLRYTGRFDDMEDPYREPSSHDARNAIEALLSGKKVPVETTKAFGCSMKWKSKMEWRKKLDADWANKPVEVGEVDLAGVKTLLENQQDKLRLVNVWATWCGPCVIEFPELVNMQRMYGNRDFEVVSISLDQPDKSEKVIEFLQRNQAAFTNYICGSADRDAFFEAVDPRWQGNLPYTMLVSPGGKVVYSHDGIIDPLEVRKTIIGQLGRYFADD
jgi:thiol-disulfide isomerase/thioredoxin